MNKAKIYPWIFAVVFALSVVVQIGVASGEEDYNILWTSHVPHASSISISPDGNYIVIGCNGGNICVFNKEGKLLWKKELLDYSPIDISIPSNKSYMVAITSIKYTANNHSYYENQVSIFNEKGVGGGWIYTNSSEIFHKIYTSSDGNYAKIEKINGEPIYFRLENRTYETIIFGWSEAKKTGSGYQLYVEELDHIPKCRFVTTKEKSLDGNYKVVKYNDHIHFLVSLSKIASDKIFDVKSAIHNERSKGYETIKAESLLSQAEQVFKEGNYEEAKSLAENAKALALDIDQDGVANEEDFAPTIKNNYIYAGTLAALFVLAFLTKLSLDAKRRREYREKVEEWKREGYDVSEFKERWFK